MSDSLLIERLKIGDHLIRLTPLVGRLKNNMPQGKLKVKSIVKHSNQLSQNPEYLGKDYHTVTLEDCKNTMGSDYIFGVIDCGEYFKDLYHADVYLSKGFARWEDMSREDQVVWKLKQKVVK